MVLRGTRSSGKKYVGNFNWMQFSNVHDGAKVEAESFDSWLTDKHPSGNGPLKTEDGGVGGSVANTFDKSWIKFDHVDFGATAPDKVTINYKVKGGSCPEDARLEIRQGDPLTGTLLATVNTPNQGSGWTNWMTASVDLTEEQQANLTGMVDDVYFVFRGDMSAHSNWYIMNLDYVAFEGGEEPEDNVTQTDIAMNLGSNESEMNFTWYADTTTAGEVIVAKASELVNGVMPVDASRFRAVVSSTGKSGYSSNQTTVTDLESGTVYAYQLVNGDTYSAIHTFETAESGAFSFAYAGDPQIGASGNGTTDAANWGKTLQLVEQDSTFSDASFLLSAGDQVNNNSSESEYDGYLNHNAFLGLPMVTTIGNHDTANVAYDRHFNAANESELGKTNAGGDSYFVYNNVLFMVLNTNNTSTAEHKQFMEQAIQATKDQNINWKVVVYHHSIYSTASHTYDNDVTQFRNDLPPIFKALDIDVVLQGHDHIYTRTYMMDAGNVAQGEQYLYDNGSENAPTAVVNPDGILYVTANSASGSKYYGMRDEAFAWAAVKNQSNRRTISKVDVSDASLTITTYFADGDSITEDRILDQFTILRDAKQGLKSLLDEVNAMPEPSEESAAWIGLQTAKTQAQTVYEDASSTSEAIQNALSKLSDALNAYEAVEELKAAIANAEALEESDYTANSWNALQQAVNAGKALLTADSTDGTALRTAALNIASAKDNLAYVISAYDRIEMENFDGNEGICRESGDDGEVICNTQTGEWVSYRGLDFGDIGPRAITIRYCNNSGRCHANANIKLHLGSLSGEVIATLDTPATGSNWQSYATARIPLDAEAQAKLTGVQDLYLEFAGEGNLYIGNFNWMQFEADATVSVTGVTLDQSTLTLAKGEEQQLTATVAPTNAANKNASWTTSDDTVATVDENGVVTAVATGSATITVTTEDGGFTAECIVTVEGSQESVSAKPKITKQPQAQVVFAEDEAVFAVEASADDDGMLSYQWQVSTDGGSAWEDIDGADEVNYSISQTVLEDNGKQFRCIVTNTKEGLESAETVSDAAVLIVSETPTETNSAVPAILRQPVDKTVAEGGEATFTVEAASADGGELTYQWQISTDDSDTWENIDGATDAVYTMEEVTLDNDGMLFRCVITNTKEERNPAEMTSTLASLTVEEKEEETVSAKPEITEQPESRTVTEGRAATFVVEAAAADDGLLTYQWQMSTDDGDTWEDIDGADQDAYTTWETEQEDNGTQFRCVITNSREDLKPSTAISKVATLRVRSESSDDSSSSSSTTGNPSVSVSGKGGTITANNSGMVTIKPDSGYQIKDVLVNGASKGAVSVLTGLKKTDEVVAVFEKIPVEPEQLPFTDVPDGAWYLDAARYVYENGLMNGTGPDTFSPDVTTNRGMIVTILYRLEQEPMVSPGTFFRDVAAGQYCEDAVAWGAGNGIVNGYTDGTFAPGKAITRAQLAAILYRYAAHKGYNVSARADLSDYADVTDVAGYAMTAMQWANAEGLINGTSATTLTPNGNATRAQVAVILTRFLEKLAQ